MKPPRAPGSTIVARSSSRRSCRARAGVDSVLGHGRRRARFRARAAQDRRAFQFRGGRATRSRAARRCGAAFSTGSPCRARRRGRRACRWCSSSPTARARPCSPGRRLVCRSKPAGKSVILETEKDVYLLPGQLKLLVGVDADNDAFYLPPPGLASLAPLEPLPTQWQLKSFASAGATKLQLDPELGSAADHARRDQGG